MLFDAAVHALGIILDPGRFFFVALGTVLGLVIGVIPGIGGLVGLALLLPFTYGMDPYAALAFLVGLQSVTGTSDTIPAVLFGVPGTVGSAATVLDGHPLARQGQAGRAFGASFAASMTGGLFGAVVLALSIPVLRPFMLAIGTPELLAMTILGLTLIASLSRGMIVKGIVAAAVGLLLAEVGEEAQTGVLRWSFGTFYLWDGVSLVALALGLFAVPELIDLAAARTTIANGSGSSKAGRWQQLAGVRDVVRNWKLVLQCSSIGTLLGAIPGVGASIIDWVAYGYAARTQKGATATFGSGDIRGVIASESSNNAKEGGALVPTLAFGIPGSASMALLLGAFLMHGIAPGPDMLTSRLDVTFTLIWTVAIANVLGTAICFSFAGQFARVATIRAGILFPIVASIMAIGAYQGAQSYGDLVVLAASGLLGWIMKRHGWPRPPLILAFVLGGLMENYLFISQMRYGFEWMLRPFPMVVWVLIVLMIGGPAIARLLRRKSAEAAPNAFGDGSVASTPRSDLAIWAGAIALFGYAIWSSLAWPLAAKLMPQTVAAIGLIAIALRAGWCLAKKAGPVNAVATVMERSPMGSTVRQGLWFLGLIVGVLLVGMLPAIGFFMIAYMIFEGRLHPLRALSISAPMWAGVYILFEKLMNVPWPHSLLGTLAPELGRLTGQIL